MARLLTVGHGTLAAEELAGLCRSAGIGRLVDVRSFPGSHRHPQFGRAEMERWLPQAGIAYRWEPRLGGRRATVPGSPHTALRQAGFRGYADYMGDEAFARSLEELLAEAATEVLTVMCAESLWWRCHRRLLSDAVVLLHDAEVLHLDHRGLLSPHCLTEGVRRQADRLFYDAGQPHLHVTVDDT
ncbi:MAG TPA: DUF488 domain-containing protein [Acidimicrobiales bacterium]|nr:DUF488 domain-containing protein [Acidimicrobiales bacterium]